MPVDRDALRERLLERAGEMLEDGGYEPAAAAKAAKAAKASIEAALLLEPRPGDFAGKLRKLATVVAHATDTDGIDALSGEDVLDVAASVLEDVDEFRRRERTTLAAYQHLRSAMVALAKQAADSDTDAGSRRAYSLRAQVEMADAIQTGA